MGNQLMAVMVVVFLNVMMFLVSVSMTNINPNADSIYTLEGSPIGAVIKDDLESGNYNNTYVSSNIIRDLPQSTQGETAPTSSGGFVTDLFNNILSWLKSIPGLNYVFMAVSAPYNVIKSMGLPAQFAAAIGGLWYMISFFVLISYLWWRD